MLALCPQPSLRKKDSIVSLRTERWHCQEKQPRYSAQGSPGPGVQAAVGGGARGLGAPWLGSSGLLLWRRPWQGPARSSRSSPALFLSGLGWLAPLPVSLQGQNQGQSSQPPLSTSPKSVCGSPSAFVSLRLLSLSPESSASSHLSLPPPPWFQGHSMVTPKQFS